MLRITYERVLRRLPVYQLADRAGISRNALSLIEKGRVNPSATELERLARVLDIPPSELMKRVVVLPEAEPTTTEAVTR